MSIDVAQSKNKPILIAVSLTTDQASEWQEIRQDCGYAIEVFWSGGTATAGDIIVEATNRNPELYDLTSPAPAQVTSSAVSTTSGVYLLNAEKANYSYVRVRWDQSAGAGGTISAIISQKNR